MASWFLTCRNCQSEFSHSQVPDGMGNYFFPDKPELLPGSDEFECPHCGHTDKYKRTYLRYRS
jgi:DNA-directed RNA polymerase subunit RPC12/RpoP